MLEHQLPVLDRENWWETRVMRMLGNEQRRRITRDNLSGVSDLDLLALLRILEMNGSDFKDEDCHALSSPDLINPVREVRNAITYSDVQPIEEEEEEGYLRHLARFLEKLDACGFPARIHDLAEMLPETVVSEGREASDALGVELNGFVLHLPEEVEARSGLSTLSNEKFDAEVTIWPVSGPEGERFLVHDIAFENGERHVVCGSRCDSPEQWDRLVGRLRQGIYPVEDGRYRMDLRQARWKDNGWSNRFQATRCELDNGAGLDVFALLKGRGRVDCGTRADILGETGRKRNETCVVFAEEETQVPIIAYVVTTLLPLRNAINKTSGRT
jgi:hypothetical protein